MSCFIVKHDTINRILNYLLGNDSHIKTFLEEANSYFPYPLCLEQLGKRILRLNILAYNLRYNENLSLELANKFKFELMPVTEPKALKSLSCCLYQLSEGNIPKRKIYKQLKELEINIAFNIINKLPELY